MVNNEPITARDIVKAAELMEERLKYEHGRESGVLASMYQEHVDEIINSGIPKFEVKEVRKVNFVYGFWKNPRKYPFDWTTLSDEYDTKFEAQKAMYAYLRERKKVIKNRR